MEHTILQGFDEILVHSSQSCKILQYGGFPTRVYKPLWYINIISKVSLLHILCWKSWFSHSALLLPNHDSRPHHVINHMTLSVIFDDAIYITKALLITDKSFICYWLAYWSLLYNMTHTWFFHVPLHSTMFWDHTSTNKSL